jgi:ferritin-like metal-binding protein YciE
MIKKATNRELAAGLRTHLGETENQVKRLIQVFEELGQKPKGVDCPAIDGIIREADEVAADVADKQVLDAALIGNAQAVEHYEITRYGTLIAWAQELGHGNVVSLLNANLKEERAADKKLTTIAERNINPKAAGRRADVRKSTGTSATRGRASSSSRSAAAPRRATSKRKMSGSRTKRKAGSSKRAHVSRG